MKIAIISDSHDNVYNLEKFLDWAAEKKIEMIIHCGDLAAPGMLSKVIVPKFSGLIHLVYGNVADREKMPQVCEKFANIKLHGDQGELEIEVAGKMIKIAFCHFPDQAKELAESGKYKIVFYGHNHKPWMETLDNGCQLVNPGTLGGLFQRATFTFWDTETGKMELKLVEQL